MLYISTFKKIIIFLQSEGNNLFHFGSGIRYSFDYEKSYEASVLLLDFTKLF